MTLSNLMGKLESVQYSAALAVTGAWRGTSREKLYAELGWESLNFRRWSRRLTLFFKIVNNLTPLYSKEPIPLLHRSNYSLRNQDIIGRIGSKKLTAKSVFGIYDPLGLSYLTQIRVGLSKLNLHKFLHNFRDTVNPMCPTNDGIEDVEHFLLLCPSFEMQRRDFLAGVSELLRSFVQIDTLPNNVLIECLLYGNKNLTDDVNRSILELTLEFIHRTGRFD